MDPRTALYGSLMLLVLFVVAGCATAENTEVPPLHNITFSREQLHQITQGTEHVIFWNSTSPGVADVEVVSTALGVATVSNLTWWYVTNDTEGLITVEGTFKVTGHFLGYSTIDVTLLGDGGEVIDTKALEVSVLLTYQNLSSIFSTSLGVLIGIVYVNMGATIDLEVVKGIAKKPIGPLVGLVCQYIGMPLIAFGLSQAIFGDTPLLQLGMFLSGCCPGGGASNMWTHLLGGRLDLSIMMTFTSTLFAFVAIPSWVFGLGPVIAGQADFVIPFSDIAVMVVSLVLPCFAGILIQKFLPKVAHFLKIMLTPFSIFNILYIFTFGFYANRFIFEIFDVRILLGGLALPLLGYAIGVIIASLLRLPRTDIVAISIETGVQNASIALFILNFTLEKPAGSIAAVIPAASVMMTPVPLMAVLIVKTIYTKVQAYRNKDTKAPTTAPNPEEPSPTNDASKPISFVDMKGTTETKNGVDNPAADLSDHPI